MDTIETGHACDVDARQKASEANRSPIGMLLSSGHAKQGRKDRDGKSDFFCATIRRRLLD
ncbi:MAG: hypothetical protein WDN46_21050 [Methylocella sp.]